LLLPAFSEVYPCSFKYTPEIKTCVLKETFVLRGQNGVNEDRRKIRETDKAPFFSMLFRQIRDELRL
jgi:hypothetical protein